jgi:DNA-binding response OmpR family regulator
MTILICDDDKEIAAAIAIYLEHEGYATLTAHNGMDAIALLDAHGDDVRLVIMDVMMPGLDGLRATLEIRKSRNLPIIMLSAKTEDTDKILGLTMGADDYVTKPFNPLELIARVKSQLRRFTVLGALPAPEEGLYVVGGLVLDDNLKSVRVDGEEARLTPLEYKILLLLARSPGRVFSIDEIYARVWGEDAFGAENTVAVHIRHIREKIEINPKEPKYLKVVWGIGYKIERID